MRNFLLLSLFLFSMISTAYAQMAQLEKEEINYEKGKGHYIERAREILTQSFINENWEEVIRAKDYIKSLENDDFFGLYAGEYWLLSLWLEDYATILNDARAFTPEKMEQYTIKLEPDNDRLQNILFSKTLREKNELITKINNTTLTDEEKSFLLLQFKNLTSNIGSNPYLQDDINHEAIKFMADYPESEFIPFIKQYIHYKLKSSRLGLGLELFTGVGYYSNTLFERYDNMVPLGFTVSAKYDNYNLYFRQYFGFSTTKKLYQKYSSPSIDIGSYPIGSRIKNNITDLAFGYSILNHSTLKAVPFVSIGGMGFTVPDKYIEQEAELTKVANVNYQMAVGLGLSCDFKIGVDRTPEYITQSSYGYVRLRYNYYMLPFYDNHMGGLHCITVGFGGVGHLLERDL